MKKKIFFPLVFLSFLVLVGCQKPSLIDLSRDWQLHLTDISQVNFNTSGIKKTPDDLLAQKTEFDPQNWQKVEKLPFAYLEVLEDGTKKDVRQKRLGWWKKEVFIPESMRGQNLALYLGMVWDVEETYLNGVKIGQAGKHYPDFHSDWNSATSHYLPEQLIKYGEKNVIIIKQFCDAQLNFNGAPFIGDHHQVRSYTFKQKFFAEYLPMALGFTMLVIGLAMLIFFLFTLIREKEFNKTYLYFGFISILWFFMVMHFWLPDFGVISWRLQDDLFYVFSALLVTMIYLGIEALLDYKIWFSRIAIILIALAVGILGITATNMDPITNWRFNFTGPLGVLGQLLWGVPIFKGIKKKDKNAKIVLIAYVFFMLTLVHDALMMNRTILDNTFYSNVSYPIFIFCFIWIMVDRVAKLNKQLTSSAQEIENQNKNILNLLAETVDSTEELVTVSESVKKSTNSLAEEMDTQAASLEETSAAIEEVSSSIESIAGNAEKQDKLVQKTGADLDGYKEYVAGITESAEYAKVLGEMCKGRTDQITQHLNKVQEGMLKLKDSSSSIEDIAVMISDVADQTSLLSLNASIEAARAGDSGRGFAVVAEEIGKLATNSISQSKTIREIVKQVVADIDEETNLIIESDSAVKDVKISVDNVKVSVEQILKLCIHLQEITVGIAAGITDISQGSNEIYVATNEQMRAMQEVLITVNALNDVIDKVNLSSTNLVEVSDVLTKRIEILNQTVAQEK